MRVFLINLDRSPDRLAFMDGQLRNAKIAYERIAAVDGRAIDMGPYANTTLMPGEIGCFLSHRAAWTKLLESADRHALVIEDDAVLSRNFTAFLDDVDALDADLIKLDTSGAQVALLRRGATLSSGHGLHRLLTRHTGTRAYIVGCNAAERLLRLSGTLTEPVDQFLFGGRNLTRFAVYQAVPAVTRHETEAFGSAVHSTIGVQRREPTKPYLLKRLARTLIRRIRLIRYTGRLRFQTVDFARPTLGKPRVPD